MKNDTTKGFELFSGAFKPISYEEPKESQTAEEGIDYGVVILPPVMGESNSEVESYPEEYLDFCQDKLRSYKKENGELPQWERDAQEAAAAMAEQAEEATRAMQKQADEAGAELEKQAATLPI